MPRRAARSDPLAYEVMLDFSADLVSSKQPLSTPILPDAYMNLTARSSSRSRCLSRFKPNALSESSFVFARDTWLTVPVFQLSIERVLRYESNCVN